MDPSALAHRKRLAVLLWILVAFFYFYLSYGYIRATMDDWEFGDYVQRVVQEAGHEHRPAREIKALILIKAEQLSLPIQGDHIKVVGGGETLNVALDYRVDIEIPLFQRIIYSKQFQHDAKYQQNR